MARNKGIAGFSANFEPQMAAPLDARLIVDTVDDLTKPSTWMANDDSIYIYKGIIVSVVNDPTPENNVPYCLVDSDYTDDENWKVFGGGDIDMDNRIMEWETGESYTKRTPLIYDSMLYVVAVDNYTADDFEDDLHNELIEKIGSEGGAGEETLYTNLDTTEITVGGIEAGSDFENMSMKEMWDALLYPEMNPTLTPPSMTFVSTTTGLKEIGEEIETITFNVEFNRGKINPKYTTEGYRSGLPNKYTYSGPELDTEETVTDSMSDSKMIADYIVVSGVQTWGCQIDYDSGEQPKSNKGNDFDLPLDAGSVSRTVTITGVYPYFATTNNTSTETKQGLELPSKSYWEVNMAKEEGSNKQRISFHESFPAITKIEFFNTVSNKWEVIGGSDINSMNTFAVTNTTKEVQGVIQNYKTYTHTGDIIGARGLRFYQ